LIECLQTNKDAADIGEQQIPLRRGSFNAERDQTGPLIAAGSQILKGKALFCD